MLPVAAGDPEPTQLHILVPSPRSIAGNTLVYYQGMSSPNQQCPPVSLNFLPGRAFEIAIKLLLGKPDCADRGEHLSNWMVNQA